MAQRIAKVPVKDVQCDELWSLIFKEEKRLESGDDPNFGDAYCFVAIERHSKLVLNFAQLIKVYRATLEGERRYSPPEVVSTEVVSVVGHPDPKRICTSHVERQNLTMRMQIRRLTRPTNGFSKKWENHWAALALYFGYYNFCRIHTTLRVTPAIESKLTDHVWTLEELLA